MDADRVPVIVGLAQWVERDVDPRRAPSPLDSLEAVARGAVADGGGALRALSELDTVAVVRSLAPGMRNLPGALAQRLGAHPRRELLSAIGGEMALVLVDHVAGEIEAGRARSALIAGTHNLRTVARAREAGEPVRRARGFGTAREPARTSRAPIPGPYGRRPGSAGPRAPGCRRRRLGAQG